MISSIINFVYDLSYELQSDLKVMILGVASRVAQRLKSYDSRKLGNIREVSKLVGGRAQISKIFIFSIFV